MRQLTYWWWLKHHGLTRRQVDEDISLDDLEWVPRIDRAHDEGFEIWQKLNRQQGGGQ